MTPIIRWPAGVLDQHAVGRRAFLIVIPVSVVGVLTIIPTNVSASTAIRLWLLASLASTLALGAVLAAGNLVVSRMPTGRAMRWTVLITVLLAGAARGLALGLAFRADNVPDQASLQVRTLSSAVIFGLWLVLIGALVSSSDRYRARRSAMLDELLMRELQARLLDEDRSRRQRVDVVRRFAATTDAVRGILDEAEASQDPDYARISQHIQQAVDERLRPLVHEMWEVRAPIVSDRRSTRTFLRRAYLARVPAAWAIAAYGLIVSGASLLSVSGASRISLNWQTALIAASAETAAVAAVVLGERLVKPRVTIGSRTITALTLLAAPILAAWLLTSNRISGEISLLALASLVITAPVIVFASCATRTVIDDRGLDAVDLQRRLDRDEWAEQLRILEQREAQVQVAGEIHNTMQARLVAAAMQMRTAALEGDDDRGANAVRDARAALDSADRDLEIPDSPIGVRLASIVEAWRGIVDVSIACSPEAEAVPAARLAVDAIEECVANASRHASAAAVTVTLNLVGPDLLLVVADDGKPLDAEAALGLGTAWMQRVSHQRIHRSRDGRRNVIEMRIPAV